MKFERGDYDYAMEILKSGNEADFEELEQLMEGFPQGVDSFIARHWITNAVDYGSKASIAWMLARKVDITFRDEEGYTVLHSALERSSPEQLEILELLLQHGAPVNAHGTNDWTPAHMAAVRGNIEALKILLRFGADLRIRTRIDNYATPLEEARSMGNAHVVRFLEGIG